MLLPEQGEGRGGDGRNYRRNVACELGRFAEWTAGDRSRDDWTEIVPDDIDREPTFEDLSLDDGSMDVYRKKQQWDAASLPDPIISPLRSYRKLMDPPTERWPVFPTFDQDARKPGS